MNLTIRAAISNVRTDLKKANADSKMTNKMIFTLISKHANWLIERSSNSYKLGRKDLIYQIYKCAEVIDVPTIDPCCGITTKCRIKRTKDRLPAMYEDSWGVLLKSVYSIDGSTTLENATKESYVIKKNNPWGPTKKHSYYFFEDGYLYGDLPKKINIQALFKDDISSYNMVYNNCDCPAPLSKDCKVFLDTVWTVPELLQAMVIDAVIKELTPMIQLPNQERIDKNENKFE